MNASINFLLDFAFNLSVTFIIVRFIYYPARRNKDYVFSFFALNTVIFFVLNLLSSIDLSVGLGFGLFAIFSVLRYRTKPIPVREMTYLFVIIALPVLNSILMCKNGFLELSAANVVIILVLYVAEKGWGFDYESRKSITYEKIDLITPDKRHLLLQDLHQRTGLEIKRCEIGRIDFLKDSAEIKIYYNEPNA